MFKESHPFLMFLALLMTLEQRNDINVKQLFYIQTVSGPIKELIQVAINCGPDNALEQLEHMVQPTS